MATTNTLSNPMPAQESAGAPLLVSLASLSPEGLEQMLANLEEAFAGTPVLVATPDIEAEGTGIGSAQGTMRVAGYTPAAPSSGAWVMQSADFVNAHQLAQQYAAQVILMLGAEAQTLEPGALRQMAERTAGENQESCDLVMPRYSLPARAGLVNSAILYPLTRALFAARARYPLTPDLCVSTRMAQRLATAAQRFTAANQPEALVWPVSEAAVAGYAIAEVDVGPRVLPQPPANDLNSILAQVTGSLFTDVDAKAAWWQRARPVPAGRISAMDEAPVAGGSDVQGMLESFRLAYHNLQEIWSLVLPPQTLLGLKRLSAMDSHMFRMGDALWARIIYDFLLAYRLRTINRGHLLGALTPLYLAWVASHILLTESGMDAERHIEAAATAFEADKAYLVSRWRWPDRFNP